MKKSLPLLALTLFLALSGWTQRPQLQVIHNSTEVDGILHLDGSCRITLRVDDELTDIEGYVYEIGEIRLYSIGDKSKDLGVFRKREISHRNGITFSLRADAIAEMPEQGLLIVKEIRRFDPQNQEEKLDIPGEQLSIRFIKDQH